MSFSSLTQSTTVSLKEIVLLLSDTADLIGFTDYHHSKRVAFMAEQCAKELNLSEDLTQRIVSAGLLHDIGVSTTLTHELLVTQLHWENADEHCTKGYHLLLKIPCLLDYAKVVLYHHTKWEELQSQGITEQEQLICNLIYLVDRVDALLYQYFNLHPNASPLQAKGDVCLQLSKIKEFFNPKLMNAFEQAARKDTFWLNLSDKHLHQYIKQRELSQSDSINWQSLLSLAQVISLIVDSKNTFTCEHSHAVANLCAYLATKAHLSSQQVVQLAIAGYLHDLGKLKIPDYILEKKGVLNSGERLLMKGHSLDSKAILKRITTIEEVADWVGSHHEYLDGSGYPDQTSNDDLPLPVRILTISDIFQALVQERPYSSSMELNEVIDVLINMTKQGKLDQDVMQLVQDNAQHCWQLAKCQLQLLPV